jgi:predicted TIM-barrel fold metal-dependent hydrolase
LINDAHVHFFSSPFFQALAHQRDAVSPISPEVLCHELQWEAPGPAEALADRWVAELDRHGVRRTALIASIPGDEESVSLAVRRHPGRFVGFFMVNPAADDSVPCVHRALTDLALKVVCLFPAMHHVPLNDERTVRVVEAVAEVPGAAVFVHCGVLTVGVRRKLGLRSTFDLRLGNPLGVSRLALDFPTVPFIIPHFGAGLLREALMAADACGNVHLDTSSANGWMRYTPGLTLEAVFRAALAVAGPSRVLFGTDSSFFPRGWQQPVYDIQKRTLDDLGVTDADQAQVFRENFNRLFPPPVA